MRKNDETTSGQIQKKLVKHGINVSLFTLWRARKQQGWTWTKERRNEVVEIENKLKLCEELCATDPTQKNIEDLEKNEIEYDSVYDYITQLSRGYTCNVLLVPVDSFFKKNCRVASAR